MTERARNRTGEVIQRESYICREHQNNNKERHRKERES
jgi:hypothetical protein